MADAVDQLIVDLEAQVRPPAVLVIDDFHVVDSDDVVLESVSRFVRNQPDWLHLVLISRREPKLPIDRMRSRGQLGEIHFAELRFSPDEAVELMTRLSPSLSAEHIGAAVERADGWATSLQLAALAARSLRAQTLAPGPGHEDEMLVRDYVLHEVLANEAPEVIDVLSAAAAVPRINPKLAHTMTDRPDAGELLRTAEARGLFLTRRGVDGWFELHALVRGVLTADLATRAPNRLTELHTRAARWFEEAGEVVVALDQWLLAGRQREALRLLLASYSELYDSGRESTIKRTIAAIPMAVAVSDLDAMLEYTWCHLLIDRRRFTELVEQLTWWIDRSTPDDTVRVRVKSCGLRRRTSAALGRERGAESTGDARSGRVVVEGSARTVRGQRDRTRAGAVGVLGRCIRRGAPGRDRLESLSRASIGVRRDSGDGAGAGGAAVGSAPRGRRRSSRLMGRGHDHPARRVGHCRGVGASGAR